MNSGFTIDGVFLPASAEEEPFYVYEVSGSSPSPPPLTVTCFLGGSESWMYDFGGTLSDASLCPCDVGAGEVITTMGAVLTHTPGPTIPVIYFCSNGMNLIVITIVPGMDVSMDTHCYKLLSSSVNLLHVLGIDSWPCTTGNVI